MGGLKTGLGPNGILYETDSDCEIRGSFYYYLNIQAKPFCYKKFKYLMAIKMIFLFLLLLNCIQLLGCKYPKIYIFENINIKVTSRITGNDYIEERSCFYNLRCL